jgi:hypothetical protein
MTDADRHRLSDEANEEVFHSRIVPGKLSGGQPQEQPVAHLLGGQPGVGKSATQTALMDELDSRGGGVEIVGDDLRTFHPDYPQLMRENDREMAVHTGADSGRWVEKSIDHASSQRKDLVIEGTMRNPETVERTADLLHERGYRVEADIVAGPEAQSRLGIVSRYQGAHDDGEPGRYTTREAHDTAYSGVMDTADAIDERRFVDAVHVYRRGESEPYYSNEIDPETGDWRDPPATREAIQSERDRSWMPEEAESFRGSVESLRGRMGEEWAPELDDIEARAQPNLPSEAPEPTQPNEPTTLANRPSPEGQQTSPDPVAEYVRENKGASETDTGPEHSGPERPDTGRGVAE